MKLYKNKFCNQYVVGHLIKKWNWVSLSDVDGPWVCHTKWNKSERKINIEVKNTHTYTHTHTHTHTHK